MTFQHTANAASSSRQTVGIPPSIPSKGEAVLVTNNQRVHNMAKKDGPLYQLQGENGKIPLYVSYDPIFRDSSLVLLDLCSFHSGSEELSDILGAIPQEFHNSVIGVHPNYIAYFPGFKPLNGYSGIDYQPLQKMLRKPNLI